MQINFICYLMKLSLILIKKKMNLKLIDTLLTFCMNYLYLMFMNFQLKKRVNMDSLQEQIPENSSL